MKSIVTYKLPAIGDGKTRETARRPDLKTVQLQPGDRIIRSDDAGPNTFLVTILTDDTTHTQIDQIAIKEQK